MSRTAVLSVFVVVGIAVGGPGVKASASHARSQEPGGVSADARPSDQAMGRAEGQRQGLDAATVHQAIGALPLMTEAEREQVLPWMVNAIAQQPDPRMEGELTRALRDTIGRLAREAGHPAGALDQLKAEPPEEAPIAVQERRSFEAALRVVQRPAPPEQEIRQRIAALTLDPKKPEIALTQAMEIAGDVDRVTDHELQATLRRLLQDKVDALQANL